ncbi:MAG: UDP-N-acetyl-D-mannosamine dehydrogenase [Planctomycetaceae bacterium]
MNRIDLFVSAGATEIAFDDLPVICVVGLGYIGLPTAAVLANHGFRVHGVELNPRSREIINRGQCHIIEPDLDRLVQRVVDSGHMEAFESPAPADAFVLCVPTPVNDDRSADLSYVRSATLAICPFLRPGNLVVLESTSPPGTTEMIASLVYENTDLMEGEVRFAHAPERVLPGSILREVIHNDRVIGGIDDASTEAAVRLYKSFVKGRIFPCHCRTAETVKLVENASRDGQIAFANELSILCDKLGIDVRELIELANRHPRVNILQPGCGVGGHCIAVDPWFLIDKASKEFALDLPVMRTARETNDAKASWVADRVAEHARRFRDPVIACMGAAYKPNIDDLRESPALDVIHDLHRRKLGRVIVVEPHVGHIKGVELVSRSDAMKMADIVVFLVSHDEFRSITDTELNSKVVIDPAGARYRSPHESLKVERIA